MVGLTPSVLQFSQVNRPHPMRYVSTSNLSTRALEWVPVRADDTQPSYEGKVARFSAADLAFFYRRGAAKKGADLNPPCPMSGWRTVKCGDLL